MVHATRLIRYAAAARFAIVFSMSSVRRFKDAIMSKYALFLAVMFFSLVGELHAAAPWVARHGLTATQYQQTFDEMAKQGYRLIDVSGYAAGNEARYAAIWEKSVGPAWVARHGLSSAQYQQAFDDMAKQGYRLVRVSGYEVGGQDHYAAIWQKSGGPAWVARHGLSSAQYQQAFDDMARQGYRLIHVNGYTAGGQDRYAAIWEKSAGPAWVARHGLSSAQYQQAFDDMAKQGYRLIDVSGYAAGNEARYAAIWEKSAGPVWMARHGLTAAQYQQTFNDLGKQGFRLVHVAGYSVGSQDLYAALWQR
jgi:hypothetical protein